MTKKLFLFSAAAFLALNLVGCSSGSAPESTNQSTATENQNVNVNENVDVSTTSPSTNIANPASVNCEQKGGRVAIENRRYNGQDLGQIGVCYFEDNHQCEEWAMFRGECPVGGYKVTGYITEAGRYCTITGGYYEVTKEYPAVPADQEQGTCTKGGKICDAWQYYSGECSANK